MAVIKPFKGLRFTEKAGDIGQLCCPPYDIINDTQREELIARNPHNIIRLEKPEKTPEGYKAAGQILREWVDGGILADDSAECIYAYEFLFKDEGDVHSVKGFVALVKVEDFDKRIVLPHEETLSKDKSDRFNLMTETGCNFSQIYSLYQDPMNTGLSLLGSVTSGTPTHEFTDEDEVTHRLWAVDNADIINEIVKLLADKKVYIADGHHRYETALAFRDANTGGSSDFVPMFLVNMECPGLVVWPTHRIVRDLANFSYQGVLAKSMQYFHINEYHSREECLKRLRMACDNGKNAFVLYSGNRYTLMILKDLSVMDEILAESAECLRHLDVSVLHALVLERLLGIDKENMALQKNLTYTRVFDEAISAVDSGEANCSFLLNSTPIDAIGQVASAGQKMPQKSTYFYPKLTTGLVMNRIFK
jgi:uncharacterized protein (DUF1015 family)